MLNIDMGDLVIMDSVPQPSSMAKPQIDAAVASLASVLPCGRATYVAVPMTSGRRFLDWYSTQGRKIENQKLVYQREMRHNVYTPNVESARIRIASLREHISPLIDPTQLEIPEWTQDDYRYYWMRVIEKYVATAIFLDGWEYSVGCGYEYITAKRLDLHILGEDLSPLPDETCMSLLEAAISDISRHGISARLQSQVLSRLHSEKHPIRFSG